MNNPSTTRMPVIFFGHGSPMNTLASNRYTEAWHKLGASVPRPKAILAISAHWLTRGTAVTAMAKPRTIHDFGGFPQALYDSSIRRRASRSWPRTRARSWSAAARGALDRKLGPGPRHLVGIGARFPEAGIPVVQLSMDGTKPARLSL